MSFEKENKFQKYDKKQVEKIIIILEIFFLKGAKKNAKSL